MSKKEKILYTVLITLFVGYVVVEQYAPKELSWLPSFAQNDKNPHGGYILYDRLEDFFDSKSLAFETLYELEDSTGNVISLSASFDPSKQDIESLFAILESGRDVLIGASFFSEDFLDTLGLTMEITPDALGEVSQDSILVRIGEASIYYPSSLVYGYFYLSDTSGWEVIARHKSPILIRKHIGNANLILTSAPLAYTNYGILKNNGYLFAEKTFQMMSPERVVYNRYYHSGRGESSSPFRYLISQNALRWAVYLTLLGIFLILIVDSRRKQRVIPLLDPKSNTTLQFIRTMGGLYHREGNHKGAAEKLINHFMKSIAEKYYISQMFTDTAYSTLAVKSGLKKERVIQTFEIIQHVRNGGRVSEAMLVELNEKIGQFKLK